MEEIFNQSVKEPFYYNITIQGVHNSPEKLFEHIKKIFINGLNIITNNDNLNTIVIEKVKKDDFDLICKYMLSIGIETKYKIYDPESKNYYIKELLFDLEKIDTLTIEVKMNWKTKMINQISYTVNKAPISDMLKMHEYFYKHREAAWILNFKREIKELKDINIKFIKKEDPTKLHIIYFDYARLIDYPFINKYKTVTTKNIK